MRKTKADWSGAAKSASGGGVGGALGFVWPVKEREREQEISFDGLLGV